MPTAAAAGLPAILAGTMAVTQAFRHITILTRPSHVDIYSDKVIGCLRNIWFGEAASKARFVPEGR